MKNAAVRFIETEYKKLKCLKKTDASEIWLAEGTDSLFYVIKYLQQTNLPYQQLKEIDHAALPKIYYVVEHDGQTIVVEEFINGRNLHAELLVGAIYDERTVIAIAQQLCDVLTVLHGKKIIHRDIKPDNLLLMANNKVKLIDFDAARIEKDEQTNDTRYLGTKGYAPPEQYGFGQTDARSDIYSLGVTLQALLGSQYSGHLKAVLKKCQELNPRDRYNNAAELAADLQRPVYKRYCKYGAVVIGIIVLLACGLVFYSLSAVRDVEEVIKEDIEAVIEHKEPGADDKSESPEDGAAAANEEAAKSENAELPVNPAPINEEKPVVKKEVVEVLECDGKQIVQLRGGRHFRIPLSGIRNIKDKYYNPENEIYLKSGYFPKGKTLTLTVTNNTDSDLRNLTVNFSNDRLVFREVSSNGGNAAKYDVSWTRAVLRPGESIRCSAQLDNVLIETLSEQTQICAAVEADNYPRKFSMVYFDIDVKAIAGEGNYP